MSDFTNTSQPAPVISEDGHWLWNGQNWVANPAGPQAADAPQAAAEPAAVEPYGSAVTAPYGYEASSPVNFSSAAAPSVGDYAPWGKRVAAFLLDGALIAPFYLVMYSGVFSGSEIRSTLVLVVEIGTGILAIWNQLIRQGRTGYSLGKQAVGIRLVNEAGQPIGIGMTFTRLFSHILDSIPCYLGFLWPLWDPKNQTFADKVCETVVINQPKK